MKKIYCLLAAGLVSAASYAQETYQSATLADKDLNGTARYVAMGGAMEALGADISTMGSNPAGIGMFRRGYVSLTGGATFFGNGQGINKGACQDMMNIYGDDNSVANLDQVGFVISTSSGYDSFVNLGFNFHKSKNFNEMFTATDRLNNASANKASYIKEWVGDMNDYNFSQVDFLNERYVNPADKEGPFAGYYNADGYQSIRRQSGYIGEYDFNISGNAYNKLYWGITVGIKDVHYNSQSVYSEDCLDNEGNYYGTTDLVDSRIITGSGYDIKFGIICRPDENSPFRFGAYINTPTWYKLYTSNFTYMTNRKNSSNEELDYKINTPWIFGLSVGHTLGSNFAIGATYEYSDYGSISNRIITDSYVDYDGWEHNESRKDVNMNAHTSQSLNGVSTLKLGAEYKVLPTLALRLGYNYVSPKYNSEAKRDYTIESQGTYMSSTMDYVNWKSTNRLTAGIGIATGPVNIDLAYQYSATSGDYHPFMNDYFHYDDDNSLCENKAGSVNVSNNRHQLSLTVGYKF